MRGMSTPKAHRGRYPGQIAALQRAVLTRLAIHGVMTTACREARCSYGTFKKWREQNPVFEEQVQLALRSASDRIVLEAHRRGVGGHDEPVIHQGQVQYVTEPVWDEAAQEWKRQYVLGEDGKPIPLTTKKYSDRLLEKMLEARGPDEFKRKVEVTGAGGSPLIPETNPLDAARVIAFALAQGMQLAARPRVTIPPIENEIEARRKALLAPPSRHFDPERELELEIELGLGEHGAAHVEDGDDIWDEFDAMRDDAMRDDPSAGRDPEDGEDLC